MTLRARTYGVRPQIRSVDGRYRVTVEPEALEGRFAWNHVVSLPLHAGDHVIRTFVARDSGVDQIRLVRHDSSSEAYLAVMGRAGFPEGAADQNVTRADAIESLRHPAISARAERFLWTAARAPGTSPVASSETVREAPMPASPAPPVWQPEPWR